jgi:probable F420-dependent oxidoreductase
MDRARWYVPRMPTVPAVGVMFANGGRSADPEHAVALALAAEDQGCESLWAVQHVVMPVGHESRYPYSESGHIPGGPAIAIPDPLVWLAWAGAKTSRIKLATGILLLAQQHPLVIAKQVATLDRLTGGRCILGVGAGWLREEYIALGADFADRGERLDEAIEALREAWSTGPAEFHGRHVQFESVQVEPKPLGQVPIVIGGHTSASARRAGRLGDGFFPLGIQTDRLRELVAVVRESATAAGRDPSSVEITASAPSSPEEAAAQGELGVDRVVIEAPHVETADLADALRRRLADIPTISG